MSLAGIERRAQQQLKSKKAANTVWTPVNCVFFIGAFIVLSTSSFVLICSIISSVSSFISTSTVQPTSIPWINNESDCKHTGRTWNDNKCWDDEHSMMF